MTVTERSLRDTPRRKTQQSWGAGVLILTGRTWASFRMSPLASVGEEGRHKVQAEGGLEQVRFGTCPGGGTQGPDWWGGWQGPPQFHHGNLPSPRNPVSLLHVTLTGLMRFLDILALSFFKELQLQHLTSHLCILAERFPRGC